MSATEPSEHQITEEDIAAIWGTFAKCYLAELLNGKYSVEEVRGDALSLIGSKFDPRQVLAKEAQP
ncbi:hypothetical protein [Rhizobiales bacterium 3FA27D7]|jgi:hypothetical protein|uniref:hypothetical protein n=1 Tax=Mesorhizobium sp. 2RAF21 TaxID=3232995 RepID=UPI0010F5124D